MGGENSGVMAMQGERGELVPSANEMEPSWIPGRAIEMGLLRKVEELIPHSYCIISVGGKGPVCYMLLTWL